tara:strand:+ start:5541 stop:6299 length:759 start_codon:yes stop_codon:yes gene_type:complete
MGELHLLPTTLKYLAGAAAGCLLFSATASAQVSQWRSAATDASLEQGEIHLGLFHDGEQDGFMRLGWSTQEDGLHIFDRSMWASQELYESLEGRVDLVSLAPQDFHIRLHRGASYMVLDVTFDGDQVQGERSLVHPGQEPALRVIENTLPAGTVARATLFVLAAVAPMQLGDTFTLDWYEPSVNAVEAVTITAAGVEEVDTPAGHFTALRLEQRGGSPANDIFVDQASGRIVRIDIADMSVQFLALAETPDE